MEPGQDMWPDPTRWLLTRWPDLTQSLSIVKQILDNGFIAVSVTCQETKPFSGLIYSIIYTPYTYDQNRTIIEML